MNCPFWSVREGSKGLNSASNYHACSNTCALYMNGSCAFTVIATELSKKKSKDQQQVS